MKKFVPLLAVVLLNMISNGGSDELTSPDVTQIASDNKDHTSSLYETIPAVARIVTAITLQNGLSDGSIKADDVIVDLLNIGSVSLVEIEENFKSEAGDSLINQLNSNSYKTYLKYIKDSEIMEKSFIEMHEIVEKWNILKLQLREVPTKQNFTTLDKINNWNNVSILQNVNISEIISMLDDVIEEKNAEYESLKDRLKAFVDLMSSATNQHGNVKSLLLSLIPFCEFFDLIKQLNRRPSPTFVSSMNGILDHVKNIIPFDVSPSLAIANKILSWHSRRPSLTAPGFVNGYIDLKKLENDTKYSWIDEAIISINGVYSVAILEPTMEKFGNIINAVSTPENRRTVGQLNTLNIFLVSSRDVRETLQKVNGCSVIKEIKDTSSSISSLSLQIRMLLKMIYALETVSISITEKHKAIITDLSAETKQQDLRELADIIKFLKKPIEVIQRGKPENIVAEIQRNKEYITTFNNDYYMRSFTKSLECFAGIGEPLQKAYRTFLATSTFRLIMNNLNDGNYGERLNNIFMTIGNSRELIAPLREVAETIKEDKSVNVLKLRNLTGLEPFTKPLAEAAFVLVMIKRAKELRNELASFMTDGQLIQSTIDRHKDEIFKKEFLKYWGNFDNTILEIITFFAYINAWDEKFGNSSITEITEYGNSLKELATVPSVELDIQRRTIAVEKFQRVNNDTNIMSALVRLDGCLWKLSKLDLQFTGYRKSLEQMPRTLTNVHNVFRGNAVNEKDKLKKKIDAENQEERNMLIFLCIFLGVCAFIIIAGTIWCCFDKQSMYHINKHKRCHKEPELMSSIEISPPFEYEPVAPKESNEERQINPQREEKSMKFDPPFPNGYPGEIMPKLNSPKKEKPRSVSLAVGNSCLQKSFNAAPPCPNGYPGENMP